MQKLDTDDWVSSRCCSHLSGRKFESRARLSIQDKVPADMPCHATNVLAGFFNNSGTLVNQQSTSFREEHFQPLLNNAMEGEQIRPNVWDSQNVVKRQGGFLACG
jgi:hypothetical protein